MGLVELLTAGKVRKTRAGYVTITRRTVSVPKVFVLVYNQEILDKGPGDYLDGLLEHQNIYNIILGEEIGFANEDLGRYVERRIAQENKIEQMSKGGRLLREVLLLPFMPIAWPATKYAIGQEKRYSNSYTSIPETLERGKDFLNEQELPEELMPKLGECIKTLEEIQQKCQRLKDKNKDTIEALKKFYNMLYPVFPMK